MSKPMIQRLWCLQCCGLRAKECAKKRPRAPVCAKLWSEGSGTCAFNTMVLVCEMLWSKGRSMRNAGQKAQDVCIKFQRSRLSHILCVWSACKAMIQRPKADVRLICTV